MAALEKGLPLNGKEKFMARQSGSSNISESIQKKAYELWEKDGRKHGCDMQYWLQAEKIIKSQTKK